MEKQRYVRNLMCVYGGDTVPCNEGKGKVH